MTLSSEAVDFSGVSNPSKLTIGNTALDVY
jgi:hypothetical protein